MIVLAETLTPQTLKATHMRMWHKIGHKATSDVIYDAMGETVDSDAFDKLDVLWGVIHGTIRDEL